MITFVLRQVVRAIALTIAFICSHFMSVEHVTDTIPFYDIVTVFGIPFRLPDWLFRLIYGLGATFVSIAEKED